MNGSRSIAVCTIAGFGFLACLGSCVSPQAVRAASAYQSTVDMLDAFLRQYVETPDHFESTPLRTPQDLDPAHFFQILTNISLESGYCLDYILFRRNDYRSMRLYARKAEQEPYASFGEYFRATPEDNRTRELDMPVYMDHVRTDASDEGYLQFVTLALLGENFYVRHRPADTIICTRDRLEGHLERLYGRGAPKSLLPVIREIDPTPTVKTTGDTVTVTVVTVNESVINRQEWTLKRSFPHSLLRRKIRTLASWNLPEWHRKL